MAGPKKQKRRPRGLFAAPIRQRVLPHETRAEAQARWEREREIEQDRDDDPRLVGGRVMPVRYD